MKKTLTILAALLTAAMLIGCATTKEAAPVVEEAAPAVVSATDDDIAETVCGTWNANKTEYVLDLTKAAGCNDWVVNADGTATLTYTSDWASVMFPIPYTDDYFMDNVKKIVMCISCDYDGSKNFAFKISDNLYTAWENGGGMFGQGDHCSAYLFNNYYDTWDDYVLELYFGDCDWGFDSLREIESLANSISLDGVKSFGFCDNQTAKPVVYNFKYIKYCTE